MKAETRDQYIEAWELHIREIGSLNWHLRNLSDRQELSDIQHRLRILLERAGSDFAADLAKRKGAAHE